MNRGFTLIEMLIGLAVILIAISLGVAGISGTSDNISFGVNGITESRCIDGYKFVVDQTGNARQILDEYGKGSRCYGNPDPGKIGSFGSNR
jgi:prepilin-type N-terminal cleavage/methylation domain-containing protein